ncbi:queuine tRNA-ribosyltransferase [Thermaurantimonas aggregans]|uniref:Queuine tRNA-ribosyltransferase n=1 Tax=Thermaurantimonas aggregans TaxID=2173829 RepID=A0A401XL62_9FLAO|nr:tRNA guanosine(34) transglycosylase Tgt [Thermaurantimonas aggregans]MCX8149703.1 tRNA guanosine(34) transglycosylase Tgt [Thermaurantimonas aggregans]GCD77728.1 queuine tRNA-ribosyltransferase [Thermaurantimonas aggregans]
MLTFQLQATDPHSKARAGCITTDHGQIETPIFMPVGTAGTVKATHQYELTDDIRAQIILGNTYHLYLRPGTEILKKAGGLHRFIGWQRPILTDSGGYQVFSLADSRKLTEEGARFKSHIDGSYHLFTPESVIDIQRAIGADIIMAFDECPPWPCDERYAEESMHLTHRWLDRCIARMQTTEPLYGYGQSVFPIVQGSTIARLRRESAEYIAAKDMPGNAIGGLSVGEPPELMYEMTDLVTDILPAHKPRYLMGVGTPENILNAIALGVDMFDCVMPTRNGRNGMLFTTEGIINIKNRKWAEDFSPIDPAGISRVDTLYTKAYLRHLFVADEYLARQIASVHNLAFYLWLVREARSHILAGTFPDWKRTILPIITRRL